MSACGQRVINLTTSLGLLVALSGAAFAQTPPVPAPAPDDEPPPPVMRAPGPPPAEPPPAAPVPPPVPPPGVAPPADVGEPAPATGVSSPDSFLPTLKGPIGLYGMSTAEVGPLHHLRLGLHGQYFKASNFLVEGVDRMGDTNTRLEGSFSFGYTPHPSIELFGAILTSSNRNVRSKLETDRRDPELIKSFGDLILGGKGVLPVARGFTAGAELGLRFLSSISDLSFSPGSTSFWIGAVGSLDLRETARAPIRFHANANFYLDNSSNLYDFSATSIFTREVAMFAYGIAYSRLRFALGMDFPLEHRTAPVPLLPFVEYHAEVVTASADPAFAADMYQTVVNRDQHWMTVGLRARVAGGFTLGAGLDVGLRSVGYQFGPPVPPYNVIFGMAFPFDIAAFKRPVIVTRTVESKVAAPAPATTGTVTGSVKGGDGKPVADAVVSFAGIAHARVATDPDGTFSSGPLEPGSVEVTVNAPGFESASAKATVATGSATNIDVTLKAKVVTGNVRGRVTDPKGNGVAATLRFSGASTFEAKSDAGGAYSAALPPGPYKVVVDATGLPSKEAPLDIVAGQDRQLDIAFKPSNPDVTLTPKGIQLRVPIKFKQGKPKLETVIKNELDGVAELMAEHPEIKTLRIEAHWGGPVGGKGGGKGGPGAAARKLTEQQANLIKDYLVSKGVAADRLDAVARGADSPLVPNLSPANRAKNRRVELITVM
jgi:outer membrane protein OmpA-like peptidoglycan-associated protein